MAKIKRFFLTRVLPVVVLGETFHIVVFHSL